MLPDIAHFILMLFLCGTLIRLFEYHFSETLIGKWAIFAY